MAKNLKNAKSWAQKVTFPHAPLAFENRIFTSNNPREIAQTIHDAYKNDTVKKGTPLQAAISRINFYINRAGSNLNTEQKHTLVQTKDELRSLFRSNRLM